MNETRARNVLRASGVLMLLPAAWPRVEAWFAGRHSTTSLATLAGLVAVGAAFLRNSGAVPPPRTHAWFSLTAQTFTLLAILATGGEFDATLLTIVAAQAAMLLGTAAAAVWVAAQSVAMGAILLGVWGPGFAATYFVPHTLFQLFAYGAILVLARMKANADALAETNAELLAARGALEYSARQLERLRIAHELHDGLGHRLTALSLKVAAARRPHHAAVDARWLDEVAALTRSLHAEVRDVVSAMRGDGHKDLSSALETLALGAEPRVHIQVDPRVPALPAASVHVLFRSVQEAITNAIQHAHAQNVWIDCREVHGALELTARDDGRWCGALQEGNGLRGMRERLAEVGGGLALSLSGPGLHLRIQLPLSAPRPP